VTPREANPAVLFEIAGCISVSALRGCRLAARIGVEGMVEAINRGSLPRGNSRDIALILTRHADLEIPE